MGSSKDDLNSLPWEVRRVITYAILQAEKGEKHLDAKPLGNDPAFKGAAVLEVVVNHAGNTYRATCTTQFDEVVYALHIFQKKSKKGIATPQADINLIKTRLKRAREHYDTNYRSTPK